MVCFSSRLSLSPFLIKYQRIILLIYLFLYIPLDLLPYSQATCRLLHTHTHTHIHLATWSKHVSFNPSIFVCLSTCANNKKTHYTNKRTYVDEYNISAISATAITNANTSEATTLSNNTLCAPSLTPSTLTSPQFIYKSMSVHTSVTHHYFPCHYSITIAVINILGKS